MIDLLTGHIYDTCPYKLSGPRKAVNDAVKKYRDILQQTSVWIHQCSSALFLCWWMTMNQTSYRWEQFLKLLNYKSSHSSTVVPKLFLQAPPPPTPHTLLTSEIVNPLGSSPTSTYSQVLRQIFVFLPLTTAFALRGQHPPELGTTVLATAFLKHRSPDDVAFLFCHKLCSMFRYAVSCTVLEWFKIL